MQAIVTEACIDKYTHEFYPAGRVIDVTEKRAAEMGTYIRPLDPPAEKPKKRKEKA